MKHVVLVCLILLGYGVSPLHAGNVITLNGSPENSGKLTFTPGAISIDTGASPTEIKLGDILEANFGDESLKLNCFIGDDAKGTQLPPGWKSQDIGNVDTPGAVTTSDGTFSVTGSGNFPMPRTVPPTPPTEKVFFVGQQWTGDGQWTVHLMDMDQAAPDLNAGLVWRDTLDPESELASLGTSTLGNGIYNVRAGTNTRARPTPLTINFPTWLRFTRYGKTLFASVSIDHEQWDVVGQNDFDGMANPWIGLFADCRLDKEQGKAVFDHVSFTPPPSSGQVLPPGVLLESGSFFAGVFERLDFTASADQAGSFLRNGSTIPIAPSKIAAVLMLPTTRAMIADKGSHLGILMKNGDVMEGDFTDINKGGVQVNSLLLGSTTYARDDVQACFIHPPQAPTANYEIRLKDGSIIYATDLSVNKGDVVIQEASGVNISFSMDEIAQFRAGPAQVQSLAELPWKATPPPPQIPPGQKKGPAIIIGPAQPDPDIESWAGPNEEQILVAPIGALLNFPLTGRYHALGMKIALSPDSPPNAQAIVHILADNFEVTRTPPIKAGDPPQFIELNLRDPQSITLQVDSIYPGTKVMYVDPVLFKDN